MTAPQLHWLGYEWPADVLAEKRRACWALLRAPAIADSGI